MNAANSTLQARAIAAPLAGVRVIEWSHSMPAAFCARVLRDLGAQVLKLEPPGTGDALRRIGPFAPDAPYGNDAALFAYLNHGKESATLDPSEEGPALARSARSAARVRNRSSRSRGTRSPSSGRGLGSR